MKCTKHHNTTNYGLQLYKKSQNKFHKCLHLVSWLLHRIALDFTDVFRGQIMKFELR